MVPKCSGRLSHKELMINAIIKKKSIPIMITFMGNFKHEKFQTSLETDTRADIIQQTFCCTNSTTETLEKL